MSEDTDKNTAFSFLEDFTARMISIGEIGKVEKTSNKTALTYIASPFFLQLEVEGKDYSLAEVKWVAYELTNDIMVLVDPLKGMVVDTPTTTFPVDAVLQSDVFTKLITKFQTFAKGEEN